MNFLARWSRTLGMVGGALVTLLAATNQALALTDPQVAERLQSVPVFAITTPNGAPLVGTVTQGGETVSVAEVFISWRDAEEFLQELQQENPELGSQVSIRPLSLAEVFTLIVQEDEGNTPRFTIVPMEEEVQSARNLIQQRGETVEGFQGVPLYYAESTEGTGGYLTITQGDQRVIPLYFSQEGLNTLLARVAEQDPSLRDTMEVQVTTLEGLISILRSEDDANLNNVFIVPLVESLEYIQQQAGQGAE